MNLRLRLGITLICATLLTLMVGSVRMVRYMQQDVRALAMAHAHPLPQLWESTIHEAGYGRIAVSAAGLLILAIPFRKRQLWSWVALAILFFTFFVPVFVLPHFHPFPGWHVLRGGLAAPGLSRLVLFDLALSALMLVGLAVSFPSFLPNRHGEN